MKAVSAAASTVQSDDIEALFRSHNELLVRQLASRLGSTQAAREVAQEAYVRLLRLDDDKVISHQRAYLFRIAQNLATDRLRQRARFRQSREIELFEEEDASADTLRSAAAEEEFQFLVEVLKELPPKCQYAFRLHRFQGLTFGEVAEEMGLGERMIRVYVARALAYCQSRLDERAEVPRD